MPGGKGLPNIKDAKKYKAQQQIFPVGRDKAREIYMGINEAAALGPPKASKQEGNLLARNFVDNDFLRVFDPPKASGAVCAS